MTTRIRNLHKDAVSLETFVSKEIVVSQELVKSGNGYSVEWWFSTQIYQSITLLGTMALPIYGETEQDAKSRASFLIADAINFIVRGTGGTGILHTKPRTEAVADIGRAHLIAHRELGISGTLSEVALIEYRFLTEELGYKSAPAIILAELSGVPVSTIKKRIAREKYGN